MKEAFDNELYLKLQKERIEQRIKMFDNKLYLEFGGKIFDDYHASRVLPGFHQDAKIQLLKEFKEDLEIIFCINANDIEKNKIRSDYGIGYDRELLRLIDNLEKLEIKINSVVVTMYTGQPQVEKLKSILEYRKIKMYIHTPIEGYPNEVEKVVSDEGYGNNPYIETTKKLVVVTAPGANSGKLATCLSQLYHEYKKGVKAGYAKFETFPVWDLPLMHPVNVAYEAATADLGDINIIDPYHLESYNIKAVNYNRDISTFSILKNILTKITGEEIYKSPTDMGVNTISKCITDHETVEKAGIMEIIRRYYNCLCDYKRGMANEKIVARMEMLMNELNLHKENREIATKVHEFVSQKNSEVMAIQLDNEEVISGKESELLTAPSAAFLNVIKYLAKIPDDVYLLSPSVLEAIFKIKQKTLYGKKNQLNLSEVMIALSICSTTNPIIEETLKNIDKMRGMEAHCSYIITDSELNVIKSLGINLTCEPRLIG
ncbi:MAG: DUF1846 domain-containing protein [Clostridia bacterium]|jgi:uncharacterized protein (UPF0371 family)|nr:DUF1846 domain-containing protein [Clostridia bacterium]